MRRQGEIRIVLADDSRAMREGIRYLLGRDPEICLVGDARNGAEAITLIERLHPHIALLDVEMPIQDGLETARLLKARHPEIQIIFLSAYTDRVFINALHEEGCWAYIVKDDVSTKLIHLIRAMRDHPQPGGPPEPGQG